MLVDTQVEILARIAKTEHLDSHMGQTSRKYSLEPNVLAARNDD